MNFLLTARILICFFATGIILPFAESVYAQTIPLPPRIDDRDSRPSEKSFPEVDPIDPLTLRGGAAQFLLDNYREQPIIAIDFSGNGAFNDETIRKSLQSYVGRLVTRDNLINLEDEINASMEALVTQGLQGHGPRAHSPNTEIFFCLSLLW